MKLLLHLLTSLHGTTRPTGMSAFRPLLRAREDQIRSVRVSSHVDLSRSFGSAGGSSPLLPGGAQRRRDARADLLPRARPRGHQVEVAGAGNIDKFDRRCMLSLHRAGVVIGDIGRHETIEDTADQSRSERALLARPPAKSRHIDLPNPKGPIVQ